VPGFKTITPRARQSRSNTEFIFVEPDVVAQVQREQGAKGCDAPGAIYPHQDEKGRCSFEVLVDEYCAQDPALQQLARIVRDADFADQTDLTAESAGLRTISQRFPSVSSDDFETIAKADFLYDALYTSLNAAKTRG
jgi:hypothetical protein